MPTLNIVCKHSLSGSPRGCRRTTIMTDADTANLVAIQQIKVEDTIPLRHSVLWPDRDISYVSLPEDTEGYHFGAFLPCHSHDTPVCIISLFLTPIPDGEVDRSFSNSSVLDRAARFRKFACHPAYQRRTSVSL